MRNFFYFILVVLLFFISQNGYLQDFGDDFDPFASTKGVSKFFLKFKENLFKEDEFLDEISTEEKEKKLSYYRVFFNSSSKPNAVGFYTAKQDKDLGIKITRIAQQVNKDLIPYFMITYTYNPDNEKLVSSKILKDKDGRVIASYYYYWNNATEKIRKIERYGETQYLYQMELKSYVEVSWESDKLKDLTFFDKNKFPLEKYTFKKGFNNDSNLKTDIPEYATGNNNIFIGHLQRYDRFKFGSGLEKLYYIEFKATGENSFIEQKYNSDGILFKEKLHRKLPKIDF